MLQVRGSACRRLRIAPSPLRSPHEPHQFYPGSRREAVQPSEGRAGVGSGDARHRRAERHRRAGDREVHLLAGPRGRTASRRLRRRDSQTVTVSGVAPDQATKEKIVLCCGNVAAVAKVNDLLTVASPSEPESTYREVKSGDTLSKIAKEAYGDANAYMKIFEANKPMLSNPDKIYPGQKLRIPPK